MSLYEEKVIGGQLSGEIHLGIGAERDRTQATR